MRVFQHTLSADADVRTPRVYALRRVKNKNIR